MTSIPDLIRQRAANQGYGRSIQDALVGIAYHESGHNPRSLGDSGSSYGLFQLHRGGALGNMSDAAARAYFDPARNIDFTLRALKGGHLVNNNMTTAQAVDAISRRFERPANPSGEIASALAYLRSGGSSTGFPTTTPTAPAMPDAGLGGAAPGMPDPQMQLRVAAAQRNETMLKLPHIRLPSVSSIPMTVQPGVGVPPASMPPPSSLGGAIVAAAKHFLGIKYVWGGTTPQSGFDCSGLVKYVFAKFGITTPRVSQDQFKGGLAVAQNQARAGDLVFFREGGGTVGHVGIFLGGGQFLDAPHTGAVVRIDSLAGRSIAGFRRYAR